jgi:long-chain acyl-CoA synthetase
MPEILEQTIAPQTTVSVPTRAFDFLFFQANKYPLPNCLAVKRKGKWETYSTQDVIDTANRLSLGFLKMGIQKGDKVGLVSNNRPEWNFVDFALQQIGAVGVPVYPNITENDYKFIFTDAEVKFIFAGNQDLYEKISRATAGLPGVEAIFTFDKIEGARHYSEVEEAGKNGDLTKLEEHRNAITADDLLTIIYTSGTTGNPKGVMLSHRNIVSNAIAVKKLGLPVEEGKGKTLSFLPACHVFERTGLYFFTYAGIGIYYAESMDTIAENLKEVRPQIFNTVPRLLEKIYDRIIAKGHELPKLQRQLFFWAVNLGLKYEPNKPQPWFYRQQLKWANKLIFSKWREGLGGNLRIVVSGAAALQPRLAKIFWAAGIKISEGYGLTETSPGVAFMRPVESRFRAGTVGEAMEGVEIKIAEDGEILVKGDNVMQGYYKRPDLTEQVIDTEGWFNTGDIGELVEGKFLKITDRKKEMFKTSGGKYVSPQVLENKFKESTLIEQIMVLGENRKFPAAIIVPEKEELEYYLKSKNIDFTNFSKINENAEVKAIFNQEIEKYNENFPHYEQVKKIIITPDNWSVQTGELTPTLKLKRKFILQKYEKEIEGMYK